MGEFVAVLAKIILMVLAKVDKKKHQAVVDGFYSRIHADPCGVLVEQLGGKSGRTAGNADDTGAEQRKGC